MFEPGDMVLIEAPDFFSGKKLAGYLGKCKDHDDGFLCHLLTGDEITKKVCVRPSVKGNTIELLSSAIERP